MSEETQRRIDSEVRRLVEEGYETAKKILTEKMEHLHLIAKGLLEYETLSGDEIAGLLRGEPPHRPDANDAPKGPKSPFPTVGDAKLGGPEPQGT